MANTLTTLWAALKSAKQSKRQLNKLWVSYHANGTDAAIESCESAISDLTALIASMEAQEPIGYAYANQDFIGSVIGAKGEWAPNEIALYTHAQPSEPK